MKDQPKGTWSERLAAPQLTPKDLVAQLDRMRNRLQMAEDDPRLPPRTEERDAIHRAAIRDVIGLLAEVIEINYIR